MDRASERHEWRCLVQRSWGTLQDEGRSRAASRIHGKETKHAEDLPQVLLAIDLGGMNDCDVEFWTLIELQRLWIQPVRIGDAVEVDAQRCECRERGESRGEAAQLFLNQAYV